jgi:ribosomal-protein-alanine N-acetyltransferase
MDALIDGSGCTQFWLEVRASNSAARSLYEKLGFEVLGVRKNYYERPREDALVMGLTLPEE